MSNSGESGLWAIYPERRFHSESRLRIMLGDAVENEECESLSDEDIATIDLISLGRILADTGKITFAR